jgi:F-type H+-transporting ATPase subunit delta
LNTGTVAARYARALFIVTEKRGESEQALTDLKSLREVLKPGSRVAALLATPQVLLSDKRTAVKKVLEGRALKSVELFADLLLRKKRLPEFNGIVTEFQALVEKKQGIRWAYAVSAVPLSDAERSKLHAELEKTTGAKIQLVATVDPSLLGGALVRIGDRVVDRSVRTLLESIEQRLEEVSV